MDTIQFLISVFVRLAVALILVAIVWWLVSTFFPALKVRNLLSQNGTSSSTDWLPPPTQMNGLFGNMKSPSANDNVYQPGEAFNGYANSYNNNNGGADVDYIMYTSTGTYVMKGGGGEETKADTPYDPKIEYIRNLSIYQGGRIYTGLTFAGDARSVMFKDGKFPILIVDSRNQVVTVLYAQATTNWTVPGWVKFHAKIETNLPNRIPCTMVFEQAMTRSQYQYGNQKQEPIRAAIPVLCN